MHNKSRKKILFVNAILENNTPRSIRTLNFIKHLKDEHEIHVLYFKFKKDILKIPGVTIHTIELKNSLKRKFIASKTKNVFLRLIYKINNFPNRLKDVFYFDIKKLSKRMINLDNKYFFDKMIISVSPFSLYKIIEFIPSFKLIYDIGDPLYQNSSFGNSGNEYFFKTEQKALANCNKIIVTNKNTKNSFISDYTLNADKIEIVTQGFDDELIKKVKKNNVKEDSNFIRLVYGGRFYPGLRDPNPLVNAIQKYNTSNPLLKIQFDIYGGQGININEGNGVTIFSSIDQQSLFKEIINSDYNVFIDNKIGIQTPGKIYENLAMSVPLLYVKSQNITKTFELVSNCKGIKFVDNEYDSILHLLVKLKKRDKKIKCNFKLHSWKNLSFKLIELVNFY